MSNDRFEPVFGQPVGRLYPGVTVSIERITPDVALRMLEANTHNRDMKREPIANAILDGEWSLNGATIVFSDEGVLLDGQNRLSAVVSTGIPVDTIVVRGIRASAQATMDTGVKRNVIDQLKMRGVTDYAYVGTIGTALLRSDRFGLEGAFTRTNGIDLTVVAILDFIDRCVDDRIRPLIYPTRRINKRFPRCGAAVTAPVLDAFRAAGDTDMAAFVDRLVTGDTDCSAIRLLSARLTDNAMSRTGHLPGRVMAAYFIKAWNAYMSGTDMRQLRFSAGGASPESFPTVFVGYDRD